MGGSLANRHATRDIWPTAVVLVCWESSRGWPVSHVGAATRASRRLMATVAIARTPCPPARRASSSAMLATSQRVRHHAILGILPREAATQCHATRAWRWTMVTQAIARRYLSLEVVANQCAMKATP